MSTRSLPRRRTRSDPVQIARSAAFNLAFFGWTFVLTFVALPIMLLPPERLRAFGVFWMRGVQWLLRHLVGLDYEVRGRENMPAVPAIYALKHQSAWETMATLLMVPHAAIALKRELTQIPLFGQCLTRSGMIRIDRGGGVRALRSLVDGARNALANGQSVIIFPEGHRIPPGEHAPYHPGVAALYGKLDTPVVPIAHNSGLFWGRRSFLKQPGRITVEILEPIAPGLERKAFMAELRSRIETASDRLIEEAGGLNP